MKKYSKEDKISSLYYIHAICLRVHIFYQEQEIDIFFATLERVKHLQYMTAMYKSKKVYIFAQKHMKRSCY